MKKILSCTPDAVTGENKLVANTSALGDKLAVGAMAGGFSKRWVDLQMANGMPHLKLGRRRVRFDLAEVREWLRQKYHVQRRGPARVAANGGETGAV